MEWLVEDVDNMFEFALSFMEREWDGPKVPVYFLDEAKELSDEILAVYGKTVQHLEIEWRDHIGATEIYNRVSQ